MNKQTCSRSVAKTEALSFIWNIEGFTALRKLARLKALPANDRLFSQEFGNCEAGIWRVALFPYAPREGGKHVSMYLFADEKIKRAAEFSIVVLDKHGREIPDTFLAEEPTLFTTESNSWGWHEFLSIENESDLEPFLVDGDCLRVKVFVKVYCGVSEDDSPRRIFQIVQHRCSDNGDDTSDDDNDDGSPTAYYDYNHFGYSSVLTHLASPVSSTFAVRERSPNVSFNWSGINDGSAVVSNAVSTVDADQQSAVESNSASSRKHPPSGGAPDASAPSSPSLPSGVETTNDKHSPCCIVPGRSMQIDVSKFAVDPRTFDMTIVCEGHKFSCNRFVLGARSEVFKAMLYGGFVESTQSEIEINDTSSDCVEEFLTFLMTDTCSSLELPFRCRCEASSSSEGTTSDKPLMGSLQDTYTPGGSEVSTSAESSKSENAISTRRGCSGNDSCRYVRGKYSLHLIPRLLKLLGAADKYQVLELSSKCIQALARCISYRTVLDVLDGAETLQCEPLIDSCWYYLKNCKKVDKIVKSLRRRQSNSLPNIQPLHLQSYSSSEASMGSPSLKEDPLVVAETKSDSLDSVLSFNKGLQRTQSMTTDTVDTPDFIAIDSLDCLLESMQSLDCFGPSPSSLKFEH